MGLQIVHQDWKTSSDSSDCYCTDYCQFCMASLGSQRVVLCNLLDYKCEYRFDDY